MTSDYTILWKIVICVFNAPTTEMEKDDKQQGIQYMSFFHFLLLLNEPPVLQILDCAQ